MSGTYCLTPAEAAEKSLRKATLPFEPRKTCDLLLDATVIAFIGDIAAKSTEHPDEITNTADREPRGNNRRNHERKPSPPAPISDPPFT